MAYPIIKSVFDNFTTAYQNAREARAREERAKELSMREFDANQRAWNQDYRIGDEYTNYISPANQYALRGFGWADELRAAAQGGNVAIAKMNSGAKTQFATPENQALITQSATDKLKQIAFENAAFNNLTQQQKMLVVNAPYTQRALIGAQTNEDFQNWFDPNQVAGRKQNQKDLTTLGRINNEYNIGIANSQLTEMQNAENKSTTEKETARLLSRNPAPTTSSNNSSTNPMQGMVNSNNSELNKLIIARDAVVSEMTPMIRSGIGMENAKYQALNLKLAAINDAILQSRVNQIPR